MSARNILMSAAGSAADKLYVDDVFQAYTRTGTGADTTITTGIDMTKGYMLWSKSRSAATDHAVYDSARGVTLDLVTNSTAAQTTQSTGLKAVSSTGHTVGSLAKMNTSGDTYVDWVWKKAPKFFDVVTYTGNGLAGRQIPHALGIVPGMVVVRKTGSTSNWNVYHRSLGATKAIFLNLTNAESVSAAYWNNTEPTDSHFTLGSLEPTNVDGVQYVAYLFAHDTTADGIIQCGSYTGNGSATGPVITLGWEPQYVMIKNTTTAQSWWVFDSARGMCVGSSDEGLNPNTSGALTSVDWVSPTATGFQIVTTSGGANTSGETYIYLAIRRPNKPPTSGTEVYNAIARTGTGAAATVTGVGFTPDLTLSQQRSAVQGGAWYDRMRGATKVITPTSTGAEGTNAQGVTGFDVMDGFRLGTEGSVNATVSLIHHFLRRAPGFMDEVCTSNDGYKSHNLIAPPGLMIVKSRSSASNWYVRSFSIDGLLLLDSTNAIRNDASSKTWFGDGTNYIPATDTTFFESTGLGNRVVYLFASLPGISKVGSYTGNGTTQTINCGFTTGARFVLIKRTDSTGDWYIWDTARGIVSANDPHLSLNTTAAEVTTNDSVDPDASGFIVNQVADTNVNLTGATYLYLAIA